MLVSELIEKIEEKIPTNLALSWDNVGLLVGDKNQEISTVYVALDLTDEVLEDAISQGADMILTHHPLIFGSYKKVVADDMIGRRIISMIRHGISYYAMHTNYDVARMGDLAAKTLGLKDTKVLDVTCQEEQPLGIGIVASLDTPVKLKELAQMTKSSFAISNVKVFGGEDDMISSLAISPGSGKSEVSAAIAAGVDVLITGDIDHHTGLDALSDGLKILDAGHYGIEHIYVDDMATLVAEMAPELKVIKAKKQEPFWICS